MAGQSDQDSEALKAMELVVVVVVAEKWAEGSGCPVGYTIVN